MSRHAATGSIAALLLVAACTSSTSGRGTAGSTPPPSTTATSSTPPSTSSAPASSTTVTTVPPQSAAQRVFARMSLEQRVGQLFMVDCPSTSVAATTVQVIQNDHVGAVILDGTTTQGLAGTRSVTQALELSNPSPAKLLIATDQEGGLVQRLQGPGFSAVPNGLAQGAMSPAALRAAAQQWGQQLRAAGVTLDLAPVVDTVPADSPGNPPIGDLDREFGHDPQTVASHGAAVIDGMTAAGVATTAKHFPGLGRVAGNTDTTPGITDSVTTRTDAYLAPFATAIAHHVPFVMMSTAIYTRIDPAHPAAFSRTIVTGMLRGDLHFTGVIISDDLGAAKQVAGVPIASRAVGFIGAGGDMVLTVDATQAPAMTQAVLARARTDTAFRALVDAAALRVLQAKQALGLL